LGGAENAAVIEVLTFLAVLVLESVVASRTVVGAKFVFVQVETLFAFIAGGAVGTGLADSHARFTFAVVIEVAVFAFFNTVEVREGVEDSRRETFGALVRIFLTLLAVGVKTRFTLAF